MTIDNLFTQTDDKTPEHIDQDKDYLAELVGEDKKFKDTKALARGKAEADSYVKILERNLDEMREEFRKARADAEARANLEDLIKGLKEPASSEHTPKANDESTAPKYNPDDVKKAARLEFLLLQDEQKKQTNLELVQSKLKERYGNNFPNALEEQRKNLGLSTDHVNTLAKESPQAFFRLMGLDQEKREDQFQAPPRNQQRSDNFAPKGSEKRTWSYYKKLRQSNPNAFLDPKINIQMQKDAMELGAAFNDGDFSR